MVHIPTPPGLASRALWSRAPVWRLTLIAALTATTLLAYFGLTRPLRPPGSASSQQATYSPASRTASPPPAAAAALTPVLLAPAATAGPAPVGPAQEARTGSGHTGGPRVAQNIAPRPAPARAVTGPAVLPPAAGPAEEPRQEAAIALAPAADLGKGTTSAKPQFVEGEVTIRDFKVKLPPGKWQVFANDHMTIPNYAGQAYFLAQLDGRRLVNVAIVVGAEANIMPGVKASDFFDCGIPGLFLGGLDGGEGKRSACWLVTNTFTVPWQQWADKSVKISSSLTRAAAGAMMTQGISFPQDLVQVSFLHSETWGSLRVQFMFSPEHEGIKGTTAAAILDTDWAPQNLARFPEKVRYSAKMKVWGETYLKSFNATFDAAARAAGAGS